MSIVIKFYLQLNHERQQVQKVQEDQLHPVTKENNNEMVTTQ